MSECKKCDLIQKYFRNESCTSFAHDMAIIAMQALVQYKKSAQLFLKELFENGEITVEDRKILEQAIKECFTMAGGQIPAMVVYSGSEYDPEQMAASVCEFLARLDTVIKERSSMN